MGQGLSTRIRSQLIVFLALVVALGGGSASAGSSPLGAKGTVGPVATGDALVSGSFVGKVEGALIGVAVIAEKPAAEGQARTVSLYVCNGTSVAAWLTGQTPGNTAVLRSADRRFNARVTLLAQSASGVVALPTGRQLAFTAARTVSVAGLFEVTLALDGSLEGTSTTGARLTGRLGAAGKLPASGAVVATATAGGQDVKLTGFARRARPGAYRWIVLPDRKVYGANRRGPRLGGVGGPVLTRPTAKGSVRIKDAGSAGQPGYDDKECGRLANQWNTLLDIAGKAASTGNDTLASAAIDRAQAIGAELEDHCFVIQ